MAGTANAIQSSPAYAIPEGVANQADRIGPQGGGFSDGLMGNMYESARTNNLFYAANQAAVTTTIALALTYTGLVVYNPVGNLKNIVIRAINFRLSVAQAAISQIWVMTGGASTNGITTFTTELVWGTAMDCLKVGPNRNYGTARAVTSGVIVAPKLTMPLGGSFTAAAFGGDNPSIIDMMGSIILEPGYYCGIAALTVAVGFGSIWWSEIPR